MYTCDMILKTWFGCPLCWMHYVYQSLNQRTRATLFLYESLLKTLRWPNVRSTLVQRMYKEKLAPS